MTTSLTFDPQAKTYQGQNNDPFPVINTKGKDAAALELVVYDTWWSFQKPRLVVQQVIGPDAENNERTIQVSITDTETGKMHKGLLTRYGVSATHARTWETCTRGLISKVTEVGGEKVRLFDINPSLEPEIGGVWCKAKYTEALSKTHYTSILGTGAFNITGTEERKIIMINNGERIQYLQSMNDGPGVLHIDHTGTILRAYMQEKAKTIEIDREYYTESGRWSSFSAAYLAREQLMQDK